MDIQKKHFSKLSDYRDAFFEHPMRLLKVESFLYKNIAEKISQCLQHEADYEQIYGWQFEPHEVDKETFLAADDADRFFTFKRFTEIKPEFRSSATATAFNTVLELVGSDFMRDFFEAMSGIALAEAEVNVYGYGQGDYLRPHSDANSNRRLAFILYLTPNWTPDFGGALQITGHDNAVVEIEATYNSLVIFDIFSHKQHQIMPILSGAGDTPRLTIGGWWKNRG